MEEHYGSHHTHDKAHADHRIGDAEGKRLDDVHPQQGGSEETEATGGKLPVEEHTRPERAVPAEGCHTHQGELQEHLTSCQQQALQYDERKYLIHIPILF